MNTFKIVFQLAAPMQIGAGALGMIEKTECFIPGRLVWAALTDALVRGYFSRPSDRSFAEVGCELKKGRFSTFFPLLPWNGTFHRFIPCFLENLFFAEDDPSLKLSAFDVESMLLTSTASTAIQPDRMAAAKGSLHAVDMIAPFLSWNVEDCGVKKSPPIPSRFEGYVELPDSICADGKMIELKPEAVSALLDGIHLGGGRKKGWGKVSLQARDLTPAQYDHFDFISQKDFGKILTAERPVAPGDLADGRARLNSFRKYDAVRGTGLSFSKPELVWRIGTVLA